MDSRRQLKYAKLIQKELSDVFARDVKHTFGNTFITITHTDVSPDLSVAKIYLSLMLTNDKNATLNLIRENVKPIRQALGTRIRNVARIVPELVFYLDDSADYSIKMDNIINSLHTPPSDSAHQ